MKFAKSPELILKSIGISEPSEIDLELVAYSLGAEVKLKPLSNCEGNIIGTRDRAIITINSDSSVERQRFSLGHELGHWVNDKNDSITYRCSAADLAQFQSEGKGFHQQKEARANKFSAQLLIPSYMFQPLLRNQSLTINTCIEVANVFNTSITSTAIRIVESTDYPCILTCWSSQGRRLWFTRSKTLPDHIWPVSNLSSPNESLVPSDNEYVDGDKWLSFPGAEDFTLVESVLFNGFDWLVLLWWKDEKQLTELTQT